MLRRSEKSLNFSKYSFNSSVSFCSFSWISFKIVWSLDYFSLSPESSVENSSDGVPLETKSWRRFWPVSLTEVKSSSCEATSKRRSYNDKDYNNHLFYKYSILCFSIHYVKSWTLYKTINYFECLGPRVLFSANSRFTTMNITIMYQWKCLWPPGPSSVKCVPTNSSYLQG